MQRETERDLLVAWQQGNLPAAQSIVRARQSEALSIAYLLTLDRDKARGLAEAAFLKLFQSARTLDPDADLRVTLLVQLGRLFLSKEFAATPAPEPLFATGRPQKYGVENQRDRTLSAVGRLEERERVALILGEVGGFDPAALNQVLERGNTALVAPVETGRQRLRHSLDIPTSQSVRPALLEAGFDGPHDDLWTLLVDEITELQQREQRRGQALTYGVAGAAILAVVVLAFILFGGDLFGGSDGVEASAEATIIPAPDNEIELGSSALPSRSPTPSPTPFPVGDVPNSLLVQGYHGGNSSDAYTSLSVYRPGNSALEPILTVNGEPARTDMTLSFLLTPDGSQVALLSAERSDTEMHFAVQMFDSLTFERRWQIGAGTHPLNTNNVPDAQLAMAITSDRVYVATFDRRSPDKASISAYDLADGTPRESRMIDIEVDRTRFNFGYDGHIFLYASPDESQLTLTLTGFDWATLSGTSHIAAQTIDLPALTTEEPIMMSVNSSREAFQFVGTPMTPDGAALYRFQGAGWPAEMTFLDLGNGELTTIALPIRNPYDTAYASISTITSHDGNQLYVLDRMTGDVASIDLARQRLERFFPLDTSTFSQKFGLGTGQFVFGWANVLSLDGTRLYIAAGVGDQTMHQTPSGDTGVWVVDLHEWKIVDFWPVAGLVTDMYHGAADDSLIVRNWHFDADKNESRYRFTRVGIEHGTVFQELLDALETEVDTGHSYRSLVDVYRTQYGRSPSTGNIRPTDLDNYTTLPRIEVSTDPDVAIESPATVEVRILDPVSGDVLRTRQGHVRFDANSTVTAFLKAEGQADQIIILANVEDGIYRGTVSLPTAETWTIDIGITRPDGALTLYPRAGSVQVAPTFLGSDGERYQLTISSTPRPPVVDDKATLRLRLVNVQTGAPIPEDVTLNVPQPAFENVMIAALPNRIDVLMSSPSPNRGTRTALLYQVSHGHYEGELTFWAIGTWQANIRFRSEAGIRVDISGGTITIIEG